MGERSSSPTEFTEVSQATLVLDFVAHGISVFHQEGGNFFGAFVRFLIDYNGHRLAFNLNGTNKIHHDSRVGRTALPPRQEEGHSRGLADLLPRLVDIMEQVVEINLSLSKLFSCLHARGLRVHILGRNISIELGTVERCIPTRKGPYVYLEAVFNGILGNGDYLLLLILVLPARTVLVGKYPQGLRITWILGGCGLLLDASVGMF